MYVCAVVDESTGKSLEFRHLIKMDKYRDVWMHSFANELGRLAQVIRDIKGTDTIDFIPFSSVPKVDTVTYSRIVCTFLPQKDEQHRTRLTAGGGSNRMPVLLEHAHSQPHHEQVTIQFHHIHVRSQIPRDGYKKIYFNTNLPKPRYMKIKLDILPQEIVDRYNLLTIARNGYVYIKIKGGMHGLPKADILANELLKTRLVAKGYHEAQFTPDLYRHVWRPITFSLVVDNFGIKSQGIQHIRHLKKTLEEH